MIPTDVWFMQHDSPYQTGEVCVRERGEEEEEEFIQNRTRAGARFLTRWDQHAVAQRRP